jgi:hypothetical protein
MTIYLITCPHAGYDEYQGWVVIADDEAAALQMLVDSKADEDYPHSMYPDHKYLTAQHCDIETLGTSPETTPRIAYADFRAG